MKYTLLPLALFLSVGPLAAQTLVTPSTPDTSFYAEGIQFQTVNGLEPQLAGFNFNTISGYGPGRVYDFCADFFMGNGTEGLTYEVRNGLQDGTGDVFGSVQEQAIGALFSNALPEFNSLLDGYFDVNNGGWDENPLFIDQYDALQAYAAGMQIALWEIIHEGSDNELSTLIGSGIFSVNAMTPDTRAESGRENAEIFLTNIRNGTWTDTGAANFFYAVPTTEGEQERLWVTVVPEPSSALLGALGFLALLRRRR